MADNFWLSDEQWAAIEPHLPMVHTGPERKDDRRVISGIIHRLREGCRWRALPDEYGPYTTVFNRFNRWSKRGLWQRIFAALVAIGDPAGAHDDRQLRRQGPSLGERRKRGEKNQAIGRSRGGRTTKIHALVDEEGRPHALLLTGGQVADIKGAASLFAATAPSGRMIGDKGYDATICVSSSKAGAPHPSFPTKPIASTLFPFDAELYGRATSSSGPSAASRISEALRPATTRLARNFLAGLCLVTALCFWIN